ncbi:MAG TPA: pilus assembly protein TadG-related protein [Terracidiphilus sp.]|nr:pilus assembly protein TadG-related protein [Terracidiphilus sp.]
MKTTLTYFVSRLARDERGQVLPWMALMIVLFLGMAGLTLDLGHAYVCYRELQAASDAASLAGAYAMTLPGATAATVQAEVNAFSAAPGGANANPNLPNVGTPQVTLKCITDSPIVPAPCSASGTNANVIQVIEVTPIPTYFIQALQAFGMKTPNSLTIGAESTATLQSGKATQVNVAMVVDTTASMGNQDSDANCNNTRIHCALSGVQTLLQGLSPCTSSSAKGTCTPFDQVSLFTFPNVTANTASNDTTCPSSNPTIVPYTTPTAGANWSAPNGSAGTYQITGYLSDYSSNNQQGGTLNSSSGLSIATGAGGGNCKGMQTPGGDGTYYAGVIYAAQSSLMAAQAANPGSQNILIVLSDGDANSTRIANGTHGGNTYGSLDDQCQQAITAANFATNQGTQVYTIAYGAASSGCSTDKSGPLAGLSPCSAMQNMASASANFYSDATASQNQGQCSANAALPLNSIFSSIAAKISSARLIPNGIS